VQLESVTTDPASEGEADMIKTAAVKIVLTAILRASSQLNHPETVNVIFRHWRNPD